MRRVLEAHTGAKALANQDDVNWPGGWVTFHAVGTFASLGVHYSPFGAAAAVTSHLAPVHTFTGPGVLSMYLGQGVLRATADATASGASLSYS